MYVSRWEIIILKIKYPYLDYEYSQRKAEAGHLPPPLEFKILKFVFHALSVTPLNWLHTERSLIFLSPSAPYLHHKTE